MEEASSCSPLPDVSHSDTGQCPKEPGTSAEAPQVNEQQEVTLWKEVEVPVIKMHRDDQIHPDSYRLADLQTPEDVEEDQWESMALPVYPMSQPTAPLSIATVQWDTPDPSYDTTDTSSADELDSSGGVCLNWTVNPLSLLRFKETDTEGSALDDTETRDGSDALRSLKPTADKEESVSQAADPCCNLQPRDNVDVAEQTTQEEEAVPIELLEDNDEMLLRLDPGEDKGESVTEDTAEPVETFPSPQESGDSEPGVERESPLDSRLEEEQEEPDILLTGQTDSAQEPSPAIANGVKAEEDREEGGEEDEEQTVTSEGFDGECEEGKTVDSTCPFEKEQPGEPTQIEHIGITVMPDQLIHFHQSEQLMEGEHLENRTGSENDKELLEHSHEQSGLGEQSKDLEDSEQSELQSDICPALIELCENTESTDKAEDEPAMCEEVNQEAQAELSDATQLPEQDEDAQKQQAHNGEGSENSGSKEPEQTDCFEEQSQQMQHSQQTTASKELEPSQQTQHSESQQSGECEQSEPREQQVQMEQSDQTESLIQTQHSEDSEQSKQSEHLEQAQQMEQTDQSKQPEHLEQLQPTEQTDQSKQPEHLEQSQQMEQTDQSKQPEHLEQMQQMEQTDQSKQPEHLEQLQPTEQTDQSKQPEHLEQSQQMEQTDQSKQPEHLEQSHQMEQTDQSKQPEEVHSEQVQCPEASEQSEQADVTEQPQRMEQSEENTPSSDTEPSTLSEQPEEPPQTEQSKQIQQKSLEIEVSELPAEIERIQEDKQTDESDQTEHPECAEDASLQTVVENGEQSEPSGKAGPLMNGGGVDREKASRLAERLHKLDGIQRTDVVKHLDKDNDFSRAVGEEYLKFFDFTDQTLDQALRSFLKVVVLIGETQERERVLQHFSSRFHQCNPQTFSSAGSPLTLTCALMLLNSDLHGQNVGKAMSSSNFVSNLDGMNEGENFSKDLLKSLYNSIKSEPLEWAVDENELKTSMLLEDDAKVDAPPRSKSNPFQDVPHDKKASVFKQGFLQRKAHADIDGKRIPWGKRSWKTFYGVLKGMVLYLQKDEYRKEYQSTEEVVSVHHALAERAADYTKRPHVFRLQTADWRVFLFQASSRVEMNSWIGRINLVSALHSSPPFPAAVGSQRRFYRPILPASQSAHTLEHQLQSDRGMLESFQADLAYLQQSLPEGRRAKAKELEEHRLREEYLLYEKCRYQMYIQVLEAWKGLNKKADTAVDTAELNLFDRAVCKGSLEVLAEEEEEEEEGLKKSYSSPSLELETAPPPSVKVRRNISERRTYRRIIIPRRNKDL